MSGPEEKTAWTVEEIAEAVAARALEKVMLSLTKALTPAQPEPRKPIEVWAIYDDEYAVILHAYTLEDSAKTTFARTPHARIVHLREVEGE